MMKRLVLFGAVMLAAGSAAGVTVKEAAARIDAIVEKNYAEQEVSANHVASDEVWLRRVYLDTVGRIPTPEEARQFLGSEEEGKRGALLVRLLESPGHTSHEFNYWADLLRIKSRLPGNNGDAAKHYIDWVKQALEENKPYDEMVRELVGARGFVAENGAVGFYLRDRGMPLDHLSTTVQVFLGTQMLCAQCHDHPFDEWTQMDYYKLAAFSHSTGVVRLPGELQEKVKGMVAKMDKNKRRNAGRALNTLTVAFQNAIVEESNKDIQLPHDYQYDDAEPKSVVKPQTPFGDLVELEDGQRKVDAYAEWMTSPENPRFTKVIANRLWKRVFGVGVVEPVDDVDNAKRASNPELIDYLTGLMTELDYDMRKYQEVLMSTEVYAREASAFDLLSGGVYHFPGPRLRRMSAEQIWDSVVTLLREDPDASLEAVENGEKDEDEFVVAYRRLMEQEPETLMKNARELNKLVSSSRSELTGLREEIESVIALKKKDRKKAERKASAAMDRLVASTDSVFGKYAKLAFLGDDPGMVMRFNSPLTNGPRQLAQRLTKEFPELKRKVGDRYQRYRNDDRREKDRRREAEIKAEYKRIAKEEGKDAANRYSNRMRFERGLRSYVRASEMASPAPQGHFLQEFGQSDREVIENASDSATIPQALSLLNGQVFPSMKNVNSTIGREVMTAQTAEEKCEAIYLTMLSRKPTVREREIVTAEFAEQGAGAAAGVVWALLNSPQFLFIE